MSSSVLGLHHVTAIASDPQRNLDFYAGLLGLRLVKRTVNFDDPQTYHFYFADDVGTPGSIMTFFPWPGAQRGRQGSGQVAVTSFAAAPSAIGFWVQRLLRYNVAYEGPTRRGTGANAEQVIAFKDHDGLMLEIVGHPSAESRRAWGDAPGVPREHAIHGFRRVTIWADRTDETERVLVDTLGFRALSEDGTTRRYVAGDGDAGGMVDVREIGGFGRGASGAGTVHHVAFAVEDDAAQLEMRARVERSRLHPTPVIDRQYFHSVYFREPGGVLFELATVPPGFTVDEPAEELGQSLKLPPQYEPHRAEIEAVLPRIHLPVSSATATLFADATGPEDVSGEALGFIHRYIPPSESGALAGSTTLLLLHGTGGDETDLIPLGRALLPGAGMLSPRGKVLEHGAPRFFRRLAEGVFDQEDLARRTEELAEFVRAAARAYELEADGVVAVGFSNGANIAASVLLRRPGVLRGAVLLSPMVPFEPDVLPHLEGTSVFIGAGENDPIAPRAQTERLAELLRSAGADVTVHWEPGGHAVTQGEVSEAARWIAHCLAARAGAAGGARSSTLSPTRA
ncbi:MAG TPA: VOC family protein [Gemmatimonadaceae bacterium]|nr:VOC family protein [Gemmatimonadaceae bacterium]